VTIEIALRQLEAGGIEDVAEVPIHLGHIIRP
jgi:hypothetical protein